MSGDQFLNINDSISGVLSPGRHALHVWLDGVGDAEVFDSQVDLFLSPVPAPSAAGLLGITGLAATRRRAALT